MTMKDLCLSAYSWQCFSRLRFLCCMRWGERMDREKVIKEFDDAVRKAHGEGWDYVDGLTTEGGFKILQLLKEQAEKLEHLNNITLEYEKEVFRLQNLLKEQETRVLDWDEIKNYSVVWGEFRGVKDIYPLIVTLDTKGRPLSWNPNINVSDEFLLIVYDEEDRKNTRCWNHEPSDEQRQEVKWE